MKLRHLVAAFTLALSGCEKSQADQQVAVENFKNEAAGLENWKTEKEKAAGINPMARLSIMKEYVAKIRAMKSEDLPADLKNAWADFVGKVSASEAMLAEMGSDPAGIFKRATSDPAFMQTFGERMRAIEAEVKPAAQRLTEVGKKYGLEKIGKLTPQ